MLPTGIIESIIFFGLCVVYVVVQPAAINQFYGYRTWQSKKSEKHWKYANKLASKILFLFAAFSLLLCLISEYVIQYNSQVVFLILFMAGMLITITIVEYRLRKI